jgi:HEAT repeat protein
MASYWYNGAVVGQKQKRSLPAGVIPARRQGDAGPARRQDDAEDDGSRVRAKAPPPIEEGSRTHAVPHETPAEHAQKLVAELLTLGPDEIAPVVRRLLPLGNFALEEIAVHFPGTLWRPSLATDSRLPRPEEISASAAALATFGEEAIPYLARMMRHSSANVRYYAAVICGSYANTRLIAPLMQASLDEDRECRRVTLHLLSAYQHEPEYRSALVELRRCAADIALPLGVRRRAISALTQLRDGASAPLFVDLLADADRGIATACRVGLRVLTAHDFGFSRDPWLRWLSERGQEIRVQWLIEGLGDSRTNVRLLASRELWQLTRFLQPLSETAQREEFLATQRNYERWWTKSHSE